MHPAVIGLVVVFVLALFAGLGVVIHMVVSNKDEDEGETTLEASKTEILVNTIRQLEVNQQETEEEIQDLITTTDNKVNQVNNDISVLQGNVNTVTDIGSRVTDLETQEQALQAWKTTADAQVTALYDADYLFTTRNNSSNTLTTTPYKVAWAVDNVVANNITLENDGASKPTEIQLVQGTTYMIQIGVVVDFTNTTQTVEWNMKDSSGALATPDQIGFQNSVSGASTLKWIYTPSNATQSRIYFEAVANNGNVILSNTDHTYGGIFIWQIN